MENTFKLFVIISFLAVASCSKEPLLLPETNVERTISSRSATTVEMDVVNVSYNAASSELTVDFSADADFSEAVLGDTQTIEFQNNTTLNLTVNSYSGSAGSLHIVFNVSSTPPSGLVGLQEIIIEDGMFN